MHRARNYTETRGATFVPIEPADEVRPTIRKSSPIAIWRPHGVTLCRYYTSELEAFVNAGPLGSESATRMEKDIQHRRGGVLPTNWAVVKRYKSSADGMKSVSLDA